MQNSTNETLKQMQAIEKQTGKSNKKEESNG